MINDDNAPLCAFGDCIIQSTAHGSQAGSSMLDLAVIPGHVFRHRNAAQVFFNPLPPSAPPAPAPAQRRSTSASRRNTTAIPQRKRRTVTSKDGTPDNEMEEDSSATVEDAKAVHSLASSDAAAKEARLYFQQHFHHAKKEDYDSYISSAELDAFVRLAAQKFEAEEESRMAARRDYEKKLKLNEQLRRQSPTKRTSGKNNNSVSQSDGGVAEAPPGSLLEFLQQTLLRFPSAPEDSSSLPPTAADSQPKTPAKHPGSLFAATSPRQQKKHGNSSNVGTSLRSPAPRTPAAPQQGTPPAVAGVSGSRVASATPRGKGSDDCTKKSEEASRAREESLTVSGGVVFRRLQFFPVAQSPSSLGYSSPLMFESNEAGPSIRRPFTPTGGFYVPRSADIDFYAVDHQPVTGASSSASRLNMQQQANSNNRPISYGRDALTAEQLMPSMLSLHQQLGMKRRKKTDAYDSAGGGEAMLAIVQVWLEKTLEDSKHNMQTLLRRYASELPPPRQQDVFIACVLFAIPFGARVVDVTVVQRLRDMPAEQEQLQHSYWSDASSSLPSHRTVVSPFSAASSSSSMSMMSVRSRPTSTCAVRSTIQQILSDAAPLVGSEGNVAVCRGNYIVSEALPELAAEIAVECRRVLDAEAPDDALHPGSSPRRARTI